MFNIKLPDKNSYSCNELIKNAMIKRRRLAISSISRICNKKVTLKRIK